MSLTRYTALTNMKPIYLIIWILVLAVGCSGGSRSEDLEKLEKLPPRTSVEAEVKEKEPALPAASQAQPLAPFTPQAYEDHTLIEGKTANCLCKYIHDAGVDIEELRWVFETYYEDIGAIYPVDSASLRYGKILRHIERRNRRRAFKGNSIVEGAINKLGLSADQIRAKGQLDCLAQIRDQHQIGLDRRTTFNQVTNLFQYSDSRSYSYSRGLAGSLRRITLHENMNKQLYQDIVMLAFVFDLAESTKNAKNRQRKSTSLYDDLIDLEVEEEIIETEMEIDEDVYL